MKRIYLRKERFATQSVYANLANHMHTQTGGTHGGVFLEERKKLREGKVKTIELYYKHRFLPVAFLCALIITFENFHKP